MNKVILIISLVSIAVIATGFVFILFESNIIFPSYVEAYQNYETANLTSAFTNGTTNAVFVDVTGINKPVEYIEPNGHTGYLPQIEDINFTQAIFKDNNDTIVATSNLSTLMLKGESATLRVNCTLPSGSYYVVLVTARGGCFESPTFKVP
jgi:hypothetical protein